MAMELLPHVQTWYEWNKKWIDDAVSTIERSRNMKFSDDVREAVLEAVIHTAHMAEHRGRREVRDAIRQALGIG